MAGLLVLALQADEIRKAHEERDYARVLKAALALEDPFAEPAFVEVVNAVAESGTVEERVMLFEGLVDGIPRLADTSLARVMAVALADRDGRSEKAIAAMERLDDLFAKRPRGEQADAEWSELRAYLAYVYWRGGVVEQRLSREEAEPKTTFADVTERAGLKGETGHRVAVADFDGDGWEDFAAGGKLWRNVEGRFAAVEGASCSGTSLWGDLDGDGDPDLVSFVKEGPVVYENDGTFKERARLDALPAAPEGNTLLDVDGDGRLDIYVGVYEEPMATGHADHLYLNRGDFRFEEDTRISEVKWCSRGAVAADFDDDGDTDLFVANYRLQRDVLWRNDGGHLVNVAAEWGVEGTETRGAFGHGIGADFGDLDNDGDLDLVVGNLAHPRFIEFSDKTHVYFRDGERFVDRFADSGVRYEETHSDVSLADADNDGDLDLYLTSVYRERPSHFYQNDGAGKFEPIAWKSGALVFNGWGHAWFDFDRDGDLDLLTSGLRLFENRLEGSSWIRIKAPVGSRVTVKAGDLVQIREARTARGTTSQDSPILHFGLGGRAGPVDVTVRRPGGRVTEARLEAGRVHEP